MSVSHIIHKKRWMEFYVEVEQDPSLAAADPLPLVGSPDCPILLFDEDFNEPREALSDD